MSRGEYVEQWVGTGDCVGVNMWVNGWGLGFMAGMCEVGDGNWDVCG